MPNNSENEQYKLQLKVRAWYCIFQVTTSASHGVGLAQLRLELIEALEAVEKAQEAGNA